MTPFDFESEEQIAAALREAIQKYPPPPGLQEAIRERLFGKPQEPALRPDASPAGSSTAESPRPPVAASPRRRTTRRARWAAVLAVAVAFLVVLTLWGSHGLFRASLAFADVQEALRQVETAVDVIEFPRTPWLNQTVLYRNDSDVVRVEWPNGIVSLHDVPHGRALVVNPKTKTVRPGDGWLGAGTVNTPDPSATPREFLDKLAQIEQSAVTKLGERVLDGRRLVGFGLPRDDFAEREHMLCQVWVDPQTRLPVRFELLPEDPGDWVGSYRQYTQTFTFNQSLDASLFRFTPPDGYTVLPKGCEVEYRERFPLPPQDPQLASPVIEPGVGIGGARFGMSIEEVVAVLGRPDDATYHAEFTPEDEPRVSKIYREASQEADAQGLTGNEKNRFVNKTSASLMASFKRINHGIELEYLSRGFSVIVFDDGGLVRIFCYGEDPGWRPFTGKTAQGIGIGATMAEVEKAYGEPSVKSEDGCVYEKSKMLFQFTAGRLWCLSLDKP